MMRKLALSAAPIPPSIAKDVPPSLADPSQPFPKLVIFDLDYTLWDFWCDTHPSPPLKPHASHALVTDKHGESFALYPSAAPVLLALPGLPAPPQRIRLAVASRTHAPATARDLLKMLYVPPVAESGSDSKRRPLGDVFDAGCEIYAGSKVRHMEALSKRTGVAYEDMLFFDDEARNRDVERLGVVMKLVRDGVDWEQVAQGVEEWRRRRAR